jgi:hypothetical protein
MVLAPDVKEFCPNCIDPDPEISPMPNGYCGVCGGTGIIVWKDTGYRITK